ncbi:ribosomal protein L4 domain-containing protein, partial [Zopfochytrium polystomum]
VHAWIQSFETGDAVGFVELDRTVFGARVRHDLLARAVRYEGIWRLAGTASTKDMAQVRATTKKPFAQKGRGAARQGSLAGPHYVGGYTAHGPRPHLTTTDIQQKVYDAAIRSALSAKFSQDQVIVVDRL